MAIFNHFQLIKQLKSQQHLSNEIVDKKAE